MPPEFSFLCPLANGLHARPCSHIAEIAGRFQAEANLTNRRNSRVANLKSVLSLISADVLLGDECLLRFAGTDEQAASVATRSYLEKDLQSQEEVSPAFEAKKKSLPRSLRKLEVQTVYGIPLSKGIGQGALVIAVGTVLPEIGKHDPAGNIDDERRKLASARAALRHELQELIERSASETACGILKTHLGILDDPAFMEKVDHYAQQSKTASDAIVLAAKDFADTFTQSKSEYIRARAADVLAVCSRIYQLIYGNDGEKDALVLNGPAILMAEGIDAQVLLRMDRTHLQGIVFGEEQKTSHVTILCRTLGIAAVTGAAEVKRTFHAGQEVLLDGSRGLLLSLTSAVQDFYRKQRAIAELRTEKAGRFATITGTTADGKQLEVGANVTSDIEVKSAFQKGCDGIGLFRTEMLFLGKDTPPTEAEQFEIYASAAKSAGAKSVILRTFDIGGDKPAAYLPFAQEQNPFLGHRGVRLYKDNLDLFLDQLRAMMRASVFGKVRIMIPMISVLEEVHWVREQFEQVKRDLTSRGQAFDVSIELGIMIEVPSVVPVLDKIAAEVDFCSIGSNDLVQYLFAADRGNPKVNHLANARHPAFLRLLRQICVQVKQHGKWIGLCGEMGGGARNLPLLAGLGLDEISMAPNEVLFTKQRLAALSSADCARLVEDALELATAEEVETLIDKFVLNGSERPLIELELVIIESHSKNREEAIRELVDLLHQTERTEDPDGVEDAIWDREATYSTDMGLGFSMPHCKSKSVSHSSIAVLRLKEPMIWEEASTVPVRAVIMLAMKNEPGKHMQVMSKLARKLMDEDFRDQIGSSRTREELVRLLTKDAGIT